jgi:hypothetical protein
MPSGNALGNRFGEKSEQETRVFRDLTKEIAAKDICHAPGRKVFETLCRTLPKPARIVSDNRFNQISLLS